MSLNRIPSTDTKAVPVKRRAVKKSAANGAALKNHRRKQEQTIEIKDVILEDGKSWDNMLKEAAAIGHFMHCVFCINGNQVKCFRRTVSFPPEQFDTALDLLEDDLNKERKKIQNDDFAPVMGIADDEESSI